MGEEMLDELESELLDEKERTFEEYQEMVQVGCKEESMKIEYFNKGIEKALELLRKYRQRAST